MQTIIYRKLEENDVSSIMTLDMSRYGKDALSMHLIRTYSFLFPETSFVAIHEKKIIGFCLGMINGVSRKAWIGAITILKEYEGNGIGKKLLGKVFNSFKSIGSKEVYLTVEPDSVAFHIYLSLGFKVLDKKEDYYGYGEERLFMCKQI